jgi:hypothetical protein
VVRVKVNGLYLPKMTLGEKATTYPLDSKNTLTATILTRNNSYEGATDTRSNAQKWYLSTNAINGYHFEGSGTFENGTPVSGGVEYTVTLQGTGTPEKAGYNSFTLSTDGVTLEDVGQPSVYGKSVLVPVGYNPKTMFGYCWWTGLFGYATEGGGSNKFVSTSQNLGFEPSSKIPIRQFTRVNQTGYISSAFADEMAKNPDFVLLGFDITMDPKTGQTLADYVNKGGTVIFFSDGSGGTAPDGLKNFVSKIDGLNSASLSIAGPGVKGLPGVTGGGLYLFPKTPGEGNVAATDPIMAGPFGSLFNSYWGRDVDNLVGVKGLPTSDPNLVIYSYTGDRSDTSIATFWRYKGLLWVGDGGFISQANAHEGTYDIEPFWIKADGTPIANDNMKLSDYDHGAENSKAFGNILYWAIDRAERQSMAAQTAQP